MSEKSRKNAVLKYILLQIPMTAVLALVLFRFGEGWGLPLWTIWAILGVWVLKDVVLFFLTWPAYQINPRSELFKLRGQTGVATRELSPEGCVQVDGTFWKARAAPGVRSVEKGKRVRVQDRQDLTLIVAPVD